MPRRLVVPVLVALCILLALACEPGPTSTPPVSRTPTVTSVPVTATALPTASPTPMPVTSPIDLGVPAGDAYSPQAVAVDRERGVAYVVSGYGDAATSDKPSVLSVVDVTQGEVRNTAALPHPFRTATSVLLAPDGDRLFVAGGDDHVLLVVATGAGSDPLGKVLHAEFDVWAAALDPVGQQLYAVGSSRVQTFDADTLETLRSVEAPTTLPLPPALVFIAVSPEASRVYLGSPNSEVVTVLRADDLQKVADILPGGQPGSFVAAADGPQAYLMLRSRSDRPNRVAVIEGNQIVQLWQPEAGYNIRSIVPDDDPDQVFLWETAQGQESRLRGVDPVSGQTTTTVPLPVQSILKAVVTGGRLHLLTWSNIFASVALEGAVVDPVIYLGITLSDAVLDDESGRLFIADSGGTIHVLDAVTLHKLDTWPRVVGTRMEAIHTFPLSVAGGRLYVLDFGAGETLVLDAATGRSVGAIPKAGQVAYDPARDRLFVTSQGVFVVDPEGYTVVGSIEETIRETQFSGEPGAISAKYDSEHDLLFVKMTNNVPGSSARSWLQIYDGESLGRLETDIETDQQFLSGLAIDSSTGRVYVASGFRGRDVAVFTVQGKLVTRLQHLAGQLFLDQAEGRLYVIGWRGLVTVDTHTHDVIDYRPLPPGFSEFTRIDVETERLYRTRSNSADLIIEPLRSTGPTTLQSTEQLPASKILDLAIADDGTVYVVNDQGGVYRRAGSRWQRLDQTLPPIGPPVLVPAPGVPNVVFAYLEKREQYGGSFGVFRSDDGGRTWQPALQGLRNFAVRDVALSPNFATDQTGFLIAGEGIFRSTSEGAWQPVSSVVADEIAVALEAGGRPDFLALAQESDTYDAVQVYAPADSNAIEQVSTIETEAYGSYELALSPEYATDGTAIAGIYSSGLFLSRDSGRTWRQLPPPLAAFSSLYTVRFSPEFASDRTVYALLAPSYFGEGERSHLYRSTDAGQMWQEATDADPRISALDIGPGGQLWVGDVGGGVHPLAPETLAWELAREPTPVPTPTPAEPPAGFYRPEGAFADLWAQDSDLRRALGWAAEPIPREVSTAFQQFGGGAMIWRGDTRTIYVLYDGGAWDGFEDTWVPDEPERDPGIQPPSSRVQPVRGFGKVWREHPQVRDRLGWAVAPEEGQTSSLQNFERGTVIGVGSSVYVISRAAGEPATWMRK